MGVLVVFETVGSAADVKQLIRDRTDPMPRPWEWPRFGRERLCSRTTDDRVTLWLHPHSLLDLERSRNALVLRVSEAGDRTVVVGRFVVEPTYRLCMLGTAVTCWSAAALFLVVPAACGGSPGLPTAVLLTGVSLVPLWRLLEAWVPSGGRIEPFVRFLKAEFGDDGVEVRAV